MKSRLFIFFMFISTSVFSQENKIVEDSSKSEKPLELKLDIVSRYLWRGQCWGGNYIALQPTVEYTILPGLILGFWATTNFKNDYSYPDGTVYKGYQEIDFSVSYYIKDYFYINVADYYWPSVSKVEGVDNRFFNYGKDGVKTVDFSLVLDYTEDEKYKYPWKATLSTLIAGNDFRYDNNGENPKQNFTTYIEASYDFYFLKNCKKNHLQDISFSPVIGAVLNNKAEYYTYADYDKPSFCNLGIAIEKEFTLGKDLKMPINVNYTHNGATQNTEAFGKNFLIFGVQFKY